MHVFLHEDRVLKTLRECEFQVQIYHSPEQTVSKENFSFLNGRSRTYQNPSTCLVSQLYISCVYYTQCTVLRFVNTIAQMHLSGVELSFWIDVHLFDKFVEDRATWMKIISQSIWVSTNFNPNYFLLLPKYILYRWLKFSRFLFWFMEWLLCYSIKLVKFRHSYQLSAWCKVQIFISYVNTLIHIQWKRELLIYSGLFSELPEPLNTLFYN